MSTVHARCGSCGTKWFFEESRHGRPVFGETACPGCGGPLRPDSAPVAGGFGSDEPGDTPTSGGP